MQADADIENLRFDETGVGDFAPYYREKILPFARVYEAKRQEALRNFRTRLLLGVPIGAGVAALAYLAALHIPPDHYDLIAVACGMAALALSSWVGSTIATYKQTAKAEMYPRIFAFFGPDYTYREQSPLSVAQYRPYDIVPDYDTEHRGDYVQGSYKGVPLALMETRLTETRGTGKNRRTVTVFDGVFVHLRVHKKFAGKTLVKTDYGFMNWAVNGLQKLERVKLEDPVFEKTFEVFSTSQVESRYLLTTSFMERLLALRNKPENAELQCSFYDGNLLISLPTGRDYFQSSSIFRPVTFIDETNNILSDMKSFFDIIDTLRLDTNTGL